MSYFALIIFSAVDLICTIRLFLNGELDEVNPIADYVLDVGGAFGLAFYKSFLIAVVCSICFYLNHHHPILKHRILMFANFMGLLVACYQIFLLISF